MVDGRQPNGFPQLPPHLHGLCGGSLPEQAWRERGGRPADARGPLFVASPGLKDGFRLILNVTERALGAVVCV